MTFFKLFAVAAFFILNTPPASAQNIIFIDPSSPPPTGNIILAPSSGTGGSYRFDFYTSELPTVSPVGTETLPTGDLLGGLGLTNSVLTVVATGVAVTLIATASESASSTN